MDWSFWRRIITTVYVCAILVVVALGFCYSNEIGDFYRENNMIFSDYWKVDGMSITFPYTHEGEFTLVNELPDIYSDQLLIIKTYYDSYEARVDGKVIATSRPHKFMGNMTTVGQKEIWIPLKYEYSGKNIEVTLKLQKSLYGSEVNDALISTRSGYAINVLKNSVAAVIIYVVFSVTGIIEIFIALHFMFKRANLIRKLTFEAMFYAGIFSIVSAQWIINETRLPFIVFGHQTGFSILTIISFLFMPLLFFELARSLFFRLRPIDNAIDAFLALSILSSCLLAIKGVIQWGSLVYIAHIIDVIVIIAVGYYSFTTVKEDDKVGRSRISIAISNIIFLFIAAFALVRYIDNVNSNYILLIIIDLMIYIMVQVGLIYRRIGLNVKEEKEFAEAKVFAYTDGLTQLGNRRHLEGVVADYEKNKLPLDFTVIAIDVNGLKNVNDTKGHEAGDELLVGTATCLKRAFSTSSTATISRMGGDEFAVILVANRSELDKRLNNLTRYLANYKGKYINGVAVAVGFVCINENTEMNVDEMFKVADQRMYEDKKSFYENTINDRRRSH